MANIATIRGWHSGGFYVYWNVSNIENPIAEYPTSGGYPSIAGITDFCITRYDLPDNSNKEILLIWNGTVADGYAVYSTSLGAPNYTYIGRLADATDYDSSKVVGISTTINRALFVGTHAVWCESTAEPGDCLYLSATNDGMVTKTPPLSAGNCLEVVGIAAARKTTITPGRLLMTIKISEPILLEESL